MDLFQEEQLRHHRLKKVEFFSQILLGVFGCKLKSFVSKEKTYLKVQPALLGGHLSNWIHVEHTRAGFTDARWLSQFEYFLYNHNKLNYYWEETVISCFVTVWMTSHYYCHSYSRKKFDSQTGFLWLFWHFSVRIIRTFSQEIQRIPQNGQATASKEDALWRHTPAA